MCVKIHSQKQAKVMSNHFEMSKEEQRRRKMENKKLSKQRIVTIWTDGAVHHNGSPNAVGGWAFLLDTREKKLKYHGYRTTGMITNNSMEFEAVINGLKKAMALGLSKDREIVVRTDSKYLINCVTNWHKTWKRNNWKTKNGEQVKNQYHIKKLLATVKKCKNVKFKWVRGHSGNEMNEMVDDLATKAIKDGKAGLIKENKETPLNVEPKHSYMDVFYSGISKNGKFGWGIVIADGDGTKISSGCYPDGQSAEKELNRVLMDKIAERKQTSKCNVIIHDINKTDGLGIFAVNAAKSALMV